MMRKFNDKVLEQFKSTLLPDQIEKFDRALTLIELSHIGLPASLVSGSAGQMIKITVAEKQEVLAIAKKEYERLRKLSRELFLETDKLLHDKLTEKQIEVLREKMAIFEDDSLLDATPQLVLLERTKM